MEWPQVFYAQNINCNPTCYIGESKGGELFQYASNIYIQMCLFIFVFVRSSLDGYLSFSCTFLKKLKFIWKQFQVLYIRMSITQKV